MILGLVGIFLSFFILLNSGSNMLLLYLYISIYGSIGLGFCSTVTPIIKSRYFGRKSFTTIHGAQQFLAAIAGIIAPIYAGWVFDITNSYMSVFYTLFILILISALLMFFANPPKK
jgi:MFS family permease